MFKRLAVTTILMVCAAAAAAQQETARQEEPAPPAPIEWRFIGVASYQHNFNRPTSSANGLRVFDTTSGSPRLNLAGFSVLRAATPFGFQLDLVSGKDVPIFASQGSPNPKVLDVKQAFLSWKHSSGLELRAGKFVTTAGYEVIGDWSNPNANFSNSFLFGYAIPFTHTGLRASYPVTPATAVTAGVNRGWDKTEDNNGALSYELAVTSTPRPWLTLIFDTHHGPEQAGSTSEWRRLYDFVAVVKQGQWTFGANADYATEENGAGGERWYGAAGYASYAIDSRWTVSLRAEEFRDATGSRTGTSQRLRELDLTVDWNLHPNVILRLDGRIDRSSADVFERRGSDAGAIVRGGGQETVGLAVILKK